MFLQSEEIRHLIELNYINQYIKKEIDQTFNAKFFYDKKTNCAYFLANFEARKESYEVLFKIDKNFKLHYKYNLYKDSEYIYALEKLSKKERDLYYNNKNRLKHYYSDAPDLIKSLIDLPFDQIQKIIQTRIMFTSISDELSKDMKDSLNLDATNISEKADFELSVIPYYGSPNGTVSLTFGGNKKYKIKDVHKFIEDYDNQRNIKFGKFLTIKLCHENLTDRANELITLLKSKKKQHEIKEPVYDSTILCKMISLYKNDFITFKNERYFVNEQEIECDVYYNEGGKMERSPKLNLDSGMFLSSGQNTIIFNKDNTCDFLHFKSKAAKGIYQILSDLNDNFSYVEDLIDENFDTILKKTVRPKIISEEQNRLKINLYISLTLQKEVVFKTELLFNDEPCDLEAIKDNNFYKYIYEDYLTTLQELEFMPNGISKDLESLNTILLTDFSRIKKYASVFLSDDILRMKRKTKQKFKLTINKGSAWLNAQINSPEYTKEEISSILKAYKKKKKYLILNDDFIVLENNEDLENLSNLIKEFDLDKEFKNEKLPLYQIFKLDNCKNNSGIEFNYDDQIETILLDIKNFESKEISLNENIKKVVRKYQIEGIKWMYTLYQNNLSGILADDMGLGKTLQLIAFHSLIKEHAPTLIVCPKSLIYNWESEFKKRNPKVKTHILIGQKQDRLNAISNIKNSNDVYIISYDSLKNDIDDFQDIHFALICIDEAQYIKNSDTQKSKAVKTLDSTSRFALTGTPIENGLTDLWSIFDFLMPKYLLSEKDFQEEYLAAFNENDEILKNKLIAKITPFVLRRSKNDVLTDLPPKTVEVIKIAMTDKQSELYNAYIKDTISNLADDPKKKMLLLSSFTRLRQICVDPSSFLENYQEISSKLEYTIDLINESIKANHKILIFSSFTTVLDHLTELLNAINIKSYYINGDVKAIDRVKISENFNKSNDVKVILVSLKAGGTGLNLHGADTVIHLDPRWNFAVEEQATDRAHRIGQTRPVTVYKLVSHDSIEERVIELQEAKKDLYEQVITEGTEQIKSLDAKTIKFLLS